MAEAGRPWPEPVGPLVGGDARAVSRVGMICPPLPPRPSLTSPRLGLGVPLAHLDQTSYRRASAWERRSGDGLSESQRVQFYKFLLWCRLRVASFASSLVSTPPSSLIEHTAAGGDAVECRKTEQHAEGTEWDRVRSLAGLLSAARFSTASAL